MDPELLQKAKESYSKEKGLEGVCSNPKCGCPQCECGPGCTCNISPQVVCDPCVEFKAQKLQEAKDAFAKQKGLESACKNAMCGCKECECGSGCTCNISPDVTCDPCKDFKAQAQASAASGS
mmetsp:Transcript_28580/g.66219  ORF Transcript_28580/g.66219 Transcript_28580/m.66219 type:complete len:122 (+) Transcript_28580:117-482(+)|eukprot:CAMPEP_0178400720 /NCGR_PEP_ID=MMETSP0689_2-20121128/15934_1 /TAXON_ID=160604 /ORGANISM="Amphidinium massartii, Strain CS-259" /LENGTH=121 /DNA_ID=CAMNT_0020021523 /DNA_START=108 /DNA_END=473 /DNA_ORIENTATION=+